MAATAYLGYGLALFGYETPLIWVYYDYPYFGTVYRASGVAGGGTALLLILLLPMLESFWGWRTLRKTPWVMIGFIPIMILTLSKEILVIPVVLLLLPAADGWRRRWRYGLAAILLVLYNFSTHYLIQPRQDIAGTIFERAEYSSGHVAWRSADVQLLETTYAALKRTAFAQANQNPIIGLGADQFQQQLKDERPTDSYPAHLPPYNPHSTWFGVAAEAGYLGLLTLIVMVVGLIAKLRDNLAMGQRAEYGYNWCLMGAVIGFGVVSINYDLMHLRFVWVAVALVMGQVGPNWRGINAFPPVASTPA